MQPLDEEIQALRKRQRPAGVAVNEFLMNMHTYPNIQKLISNEGVQSVLERIWGADRIQNNKNFEELSTD